MRGRLSNFWANVTVVLLLCICGLACGLNATAQNASTAKGGDLYVSPQGNDKNDGSQARPWATISHAGAVATPGAKVHVAPGTYRETVVTTASGTASARISYLSDKKWSALIDPPGRPIFAWKNTGKYTDIVGFDVRGESCIGIGLGGSFQKAEDNNVHNRASGCNLNPASGAGIDSFDYDGRDNDIIANFVHDVGLGDNVHCGEAKYRFVHGIYVATPGGQVSSNLVVDTCGYGIHLWHAASHVTITNNTVLRNRTGGIIVGSGDKPCSTSGCEGNDYTVVRNNIVAYNGNRNLNIKSHAIEEMAADGGRLGTHNQYSNNLAYDNVGEDFALHDKRCENCITGREPGFVSPSQGDFHLKKDSPARTGGTERDAPSRTFDGKNIKEAASGGHVHIGALGEAR